MSVSTALVIAIEPQQPAYLSHSDAAAAPVERLPHRQTLVVSHRPQRSPCPPLSIPKQSIAFTERATELHWLLLGANERRQRRHGFDHRQ
jgi:hypothetical protein